MLPRTSVYGLTRTVSGDIKGCFRIKQILTKAQDTICKSLHYITQFLKCHPNSLWALQSLQRADEVQKHREYSFLEPSSYTDQYSLIILKLYNFSQANEFVQDLLLRQQLMSWLLQPCSTCTGARLSLQPSWSQGRVSQRRTAKLPGVLGAALHAHHDIKLCQMQKEAKYNNPKTTICSIWSSVNRDCRDGVGTILRGYSNNRSTSCYQFI